MRCWQGQGALLSASVPAGIFLVFFCLKECEEDERGESEEPIAFVVCAGEKKSGCSCHDECVKERGCRCLRS